MGNDFEYQTRSFQINAPLDLDQVEIKSPISFIKENNHLRFLMDFVEFISEPEVHKLTPKILKEIFMFIAASNGGSCMVNFTLFWCLWKHKDKSTKKGNVSPEKFLRTLLDENKKARVVFDPETAELYVAMDASNPAIFMPPKHWIPVRVRTTLNFPHDEELEKPDSGHYTENI